MDEIQFAPPEKPGNPDSLVNTNKQWCRMSSIHSIETGTSCAASGWLGYQLGPPARCPFTNYFGWEGSPTKIDYRKRIPLF